MKYDKKNELAKQVRLKLQNLITIGEKDIENGKIMEIYLEDRSKGIYSDPKFSSLTDDQKEIKKQYTDGTYFSDEEKSFIIDYLLDCLVSNQSFDCSTLGPNEYLQETREEEAV